jgi:hypothetical protein
VTEKKMDVGKFGRGRRQHTIMWTTERKQVVHELGDQSDDEPFEAFVERKRNEARETRNTSLLVLRLNELRGQTEQWPR